MQTIYYILFNIYFIIKLIYYRPKTSVVEAFYKIYKHIYIYYIKYDT